MPHFNPYVYDKTYEANISSTPIPSSLIEHYAQCGEDVIVVSMIRALQAVGTFDVSSKVCVEVGANHAFGGSNTFLLEQNLGIRSVLVEANPDLLDELRKGRPKASVVYAAITAEEVAEVRLYRSRHNELSSLHEEFPKSWHDGGVGVKDYVTVPALTLDALLRREIREGERILLLSIDIEGMDLAVLKPLDFDAWQPLFVQMEPSEHFSPDEASSMISFMDGNGYALLARTDVNLLFLRRGEGYRWMSSDSASIVAAEQPLATHEEDQNVNVTYCASDAMTDSGTEVADACPLPPIRSGIDGVLADWEIDEAFIRRAMYMLGDDGILSLDIFDTALTRCFDSPVDLFTEVEYQLQQIHGKPAEGFALARVQAEQKARTLAAQSTGAEEITLNEIYNVLMADRPELGDGDTIKALELAVETQSLRAVPDILELFKRTRAAGRRCIFVSDMYLPSNVLETILRQHGFDGWDGIYVSSETKTTKATGHIWSTVGAAYPLDKLVHIGDNEHSDVTTPSNHGVRTCPYTRAESERRVGTKLTPALLPFSVLQRERELRSRKMLNAERRSQDHWYDLGRSMGTIVVGSFIKWLAERAPALHVDRLYFCARDGYLLHQAWQASGLEERIGIETRYIHISRAALNLPVAMVDSTPEHLSASLLSFLSSSLGKVTIDMALKRAGLRDNAAITRDAKLVFGSLLQPLDSQDRIAQFEALMQRHAAVVYSELAKRYGTCVRYLREQGLLDTNLRHAMVDMGWHATMQRSLAQLLKNVSHTSIDLVGFYYGLWPAANRNRFLAGPIEACFTSEFITAEAQSDVHQAVAFLEELHGVPHGTTTGYQPGTDDRMHPVIQDSPADQQQYENCTRWFQAGTLDGIKEVFANTSDIGLDESWLTPAAARAALGSIFLSPTEDEIDLLSQIRHCATFDHTAPDLLVATAMPATIDRARALLNASDWRLGQFKRWWLKTNAAGNPLLDDLLTNDMAYFGPRVLSQFY